MSRIIFPILALSTFLVFSSIHSGHNWGDDFALYIKQAIQISNGESLNKIYDWNKISMQSSVNEIGPYLYPNGFPFLLSGVYSIWGMNLTIMKYFCSLFFLLSIQ